MRGKAVIAIAAGIIAGGVIFGTPSAALADDDDRRWRGSSSRNGDWDDRWDRIKDRWEDRRERADDRWDRIKDRWDDRWDNRRDRLDDRWDRIQDRRDDRRDRIRDRRDDRRDWLRDRFDGNRGRDNGFWFFGNNNNGRSFVPPGLAKKGGLPPGQAKKLARNFF